MENKKEQFVIYPHNGEVGDNLTPADKLIYLTIRRYINPKSLECFVSYKQITKDCGAAAETIKKSVDKLVQEGYLKTRKEGRKIVYTFNNQKKFEAFSYDFLDKKDLTFTEKAYLVASRQYMFKDIDSNECRIAYTNKELAKIINSSESMISRYNTSLEKKGYLEDSKALIKKFNLRELDKLFVWKLGEHEEKLKEHDREFDDIKIRLAKIEEANKRYREENKQLRKKLKDNNIKSEFIM